MLHNETNGSGRWGENDRHIQANMIASGIFCMFYPTLKQRTIVAPTILVGTQECHQGTALVHCPAQLLWCLLRYSALPLRNDPCVYTFRDGEVKTERRKQGVKRGDERNRRLEHVTCHRPAACVTCRVSFRSQSSNDFCETPKYADPSQMPRPAQSYTYIFLMKSNFIVSGAAVSTSEFCPRCEIRGRFRRAMWCSAWFGHSQGAPLKLTGSAIMIVP